MNTKEDYIRKRRRRQAQLRSYLHTIVVVLALLAAGFGGGYLVGQAQEDEPAPVIEADAPPVQEVALVAEEPAYTAEELETLALVIYQEAGADYCSDDTRLMVGTVLLNRVADGRFPDTIQEVALQRAQYGLLYWTGLEWPERAGTEVEAHAVARAYDCAEQLLQGHRALPSDVIYQAEFIQGSEVVAHQDGFYFCK